MDLAGNGGVVDDDGAFAVFEGEDFTLLNAENGENVRIIVQNSVQDVRLILALNGEGESDDGAAGYLILGTHDEGHGVGLNGLGGLDLNGGDNAVDNGHVNGDSGSYGNVVERVDGQLERSFLGEAFNGAEDEAEELAVTGDGLGGRGDAQVDDAGGLGVDNDERILGNELTGGNAYKLYEVGIVGEISVEGVGHVVALDRHGDGDLGIAGDLILGTDGDGGFVIIAALSRSDDTINNGEVNGDSGAGGNVVELGHGQIERSILIEISSGAEDDVEEDAVLGHGLGIAGNAESDGAGSVGIDNDVGTLGDHGAGGYAYDLNEVGIIGKNGVEGIGHVVAFYGNGDGDLGVALNFKSGTDGDGSLVNIHGRLGGLHGGLGGRHGSGLGAFTDSDLDLVYVEVEHVGAVEVTDREVEGAGLYIDAGKIGGVVVPGALIAGDGSRHGVGGDLMHRGYGGLVAYVDAEMLGGPAGVLSARPHAEGYSGEIGRLEGGGDRPVVGIQRAVVVDIGLGEDVANALISGSFETDLEVGHPVPGVAVSVDKGPVAEAVLFLEEVADDLTGAYGRLSRGNRSRRGRNGSGSRGHRSGGGSRRYRSGSGGGIHRAFNIDGAIGHDVGDRSAARLAERHVLELPYGEGNRLVGVAVFIYLELNGNESATAAQSLILFGVGGIAGDHKAELGNAGVVVDVLNGRPTVIGIILGEEVAGTELGGTRNSQIRGIVSNINGNDVGAVVAFQSNGKSDGSTGLNIVHCGHSDRYLTLSRYGEGHEAEHHSYRNEESEEFLHLEYTPS